MNTQLNVRIPPKLYALATVYASKNGFDSMQELIKAALRERVMEDKELSAEEWRVIRLLLRSARDKKHWRTEDELLRRLHRGQ